MKSCPKVLVIENDDPIRMMVQALLEDEGFEVETFTDGLKALERLRRDPESCLILLDLLMPIMTGQEFMKEFLKLPVTLVPIPVFLFSVAKEKDSATATMGAQGFIKKPVELELLIEIVKDYCQSRKKAA